jgi:arabinogalactan endo-1,4-beta-galactosidase
MKRKLHLKGCLMLLGMLLSFWGCKKQNLTQAPTKFQSHVGTKSLAGSGSSLAMGGDVGWLQQMEATGYIFYDNNGVAQDALAIMKSKGLNSLRIRVFVNPSNDRIYGHCSTSETVTLAKRAVAMGFRIMIDFQYSDTFADPAHQTKPAAWSTHTFSQLLTDVYNYTYHVMDTLKTNGVYPEWVQVGNEITNGMLWPDGGTSDFGKLTQLINQGYWGVKAVNSASKVVIHLDRGDRGSYYQAYFDSLTNHHALYDVIGMSYYPIFLQSDYTVTINDLASNLNNMASRYGKEVLVAETAGPDTAVQNTYDLLVAVANKLRAVPNSKGLGVFYWEPEAAKSWGGDVWSSWGSNGQPTGAFDAYLYDPIANPTSTYTYKLISHPGAAGLALDNYGSTTDGDPVKQYARGASTNQQWIITDLGNGYYTIVNKSSGKALDNAGSTTDGTGMIQWTLSGNYNQQWAITNLGNGYYQIKNRTSGKCLDNIGSTTNGQQIQQWTDGGGADINQQWAIVYP